MIENDTPLRFSEPSTSPAPSFNDFVKGLEAFCTALVPILDGFLAVVTPIAVSVQKAARRPEIQERLAAGAQTLLQVHIRIAAVEAPGYTPYFERLGYSDFSARSHALMIRSCADRFYREYQDNRVALSTLHNLAGRSRWHPALARQVDRLRENCWNASFLDGAFHDAACPELKNVFITLLHGTSDGDYGGGPKLLAIAKRIVPYAPSPRGRRVAFDTVLHQTFLRWSAEFGGRQAYTYGPVPTGVEAIDDFIDEATAATRIELKRPSFIPVSARRAERKRLAIETTD